MIWSFSLKGFIIGGTTPGSKMLLCVCGRGIARGLDLSSKPLD